MVCVKRLLAIHQHTRELRAMRSDTPACSAISAMCVSMNEWIQYTSDGSLRRCSGYCVAHVWNTSITLKPREQCQSPRCQAHSLPSVE